MKSLGKETHFSKTQEYKMWVVNLEYCAKRFRYDL